MEVIGTIFTGTNQYGDFNWMIRSGEYEDSLFIYNDNEMDHKRKSCGHGAGNAIIRKYNRHSKGKTYSAGISTGTGRGTGNGYNSLDECENHIDDCIEEIQNLINTGNYKRLFFSADEDGNLGTSIFVVSDDVIDYITKKIYLFSQ